MARWMLDSELIACYNLAATLLSSPIDPAFNRSTRLEYSTSNPSSSSFDSISQGTYKAYDNQPPCVNLDHDTSTSRMNPAGPENPAGASTISPSYSPLHPASVQHNTLILANLCTLTSVFSGTLAGILGLLNFSGFLLYLSASLFQAGVVALLKCRNARTGKVDLERFLPSLHDVNNDTVKGWRLTGKAIWSLMAVGQENLLTFLLFWIGFYVSMLRVVLDFIFLSLTSGDCLNRPSYTVRLRSYPCARPSHNLVTNKLVSCAIVYD